MNCQNAQKQAALYAGGDLPEQDIQNLVKHLENCRDCAEEFESLKRSRSLVKEIAQEDMPEPLPADFSWTIINSIVEEKTGREPQPSRIFNIFRLKPAVVLAAAASLLIFYLGISHIMLQRKIRQFAQKLEEVQEIMQRDRAEVELSSDFLSARSIEGPIPLDKWELSDIPGIFALLHKPDPENLPDTYIIDYVGDMLNVGNDYAAWVELNRETILSRTGSEDNIYIAVYHMPGSTESYRMSVAGFFIHKHKPYFNNGV